MDGLDVPLTKALNCIFFEMYRERQLLATKPVNDSQAMYGHGRLSPTWMKEVSKISPLLLYSWEQTSAALRALRDRDGSPYEGVALEYTHPQTGGPVLPTARKRSQRTAGTSSFPRRGLLRLARTACPRPRYAPPNAFQSTWTMR